MFNRIENYLKSVDIRDYKIISKMGAWVFVFVDDLPDEYKTILEMLI